jgi:hypothetical protein
MRITGPDRSLTATRLNKARDERETLDLAIRRTDQHGHNPNVKDAPSPQEPKAPTPPTPRELMEAKLLASPQCRAIVPGGSMAFFIRGPEELAAWKKQLGRSKRQG